MVLAMNMGSFGSFLNMSIFELLDVCETMKEIQDDMKETSKYR